MMELLLTAALANAEALINKALSLDPPSRNKLTGLDGTVIEIRCRAPALSLWLLVDARGIRLFSLYEGPVSTRIEGSAPALFALLRSDDKRRAFHRDDLNISGELDKLQRLQAILRGLELDWEYPLARLAGDVPTHVLAESLHSMHGYIQQRRANLRQNLDDYLHQESRLFPDSITLETFADAVDELRLRLDRGEARLARLEALLADK